MHCCGPPFSSRRILVGPHDRGVDDDAVVGDVELQRPEDSLPVATMGPHGELVVDGLPRAEPLWEVAPWNARLGAEEHGIDEVSIAKPRHWPPAHGKNEADKGPLLVGQRVPVTGHARDGSRLAIDDKALLYVIEMIHVLHGTPPRRAPERVSSRRGCTS